MHDKASTLITYTASGAAVIGGLMLNDWAEIIGATVATLSFIYNVWHKYQLRCIAERQANDFCNSSIFED